MGNKLKKREMETSKWFEEVNKRKGPEKRKRDGKRRQEGERERERERETIAVIGRSFVSMLVILIIVLYCDD